MDEYYDLERQKGEYYSWFDLFTSSKARGLGDEHVDVKTPIAQALILLLGKRRTVRPEA